MTIASPFRRPEKPGKNPNRPHITLYLGGATKDALKAVRAYPNKEAGGMSRAARINTICERYEIFVTGFLPTLSEAEWCGLMTIFEGGITAKLFQNLWSADHGLFEYIRAAHEAGVGQDWVYDREALERSISEWSEEVLFGVAEIADRFWASDLDDGRSPRQRLEDCGAKVG